MLVNGCWDACSSQRIEVDGSGMTMLAVGMLAATEERQVLMAAERLATTRKGWFCLCNASQFIEGEGSLWFPKGKRKCWS
ncbi:unnamed protein product [Prunus armeniaca]